MKNPHLKSILAAALCYVVTISCNDNVEVLSGAYYNTSVLATDNVNLELPLGQLDAKLGGNFVVIGPNNGSKVDKIDIYASFSDIVTNRAPSQSVDNILLTTIKGSDFAKNIGNSLRPEFNYEISMEQLLAMTGIDESAVNGSDQFILTHTIKDLDGNEFSYNFNGQVVCEIPAEVTTVFLEITDSYGDGWDGAYLDVIINGIATTYTITAGSQETFEIDIPNGATLELVYYPGNYETEHSYKLYGPGNENIITDGPSPAAGAKVLNFCSFYQEPCDPIPPTPGDWTLTLEDLYADTWDGASLDIIIDGVSTNYVMDNGLLSQDFVINVPEGTATLEVNYNPGAYESEHSFSLKSAYNGGSIVISAGPGPTPGLQTLDYCNF